METRVHWGLLYKVMLGHGQKDFRAQQDLGGRGTGMGTSQEPPKRGTQRISVKIADRSITWMIVKHHFGGFSFSVQTRGSKMRLNLIGKETEFELSEVRWWL